MSFEDVFDQGLVDYGPCFEHGDDKYDTRIDVYGDLLTFFSNRFQNREELAKGTFELLKKADTAKLKSEGFSVPEKWTYFEKLCQNIYKIPGLPDPASAKEHKNPFDDSTPSKKNVFDTLGAYGPLKNNPSEVGVKTSADEIRAKGYPDGVIVLTILHEMMHAAMAAGEGKLNDDFWYYKEEALANVFALRLLRGSEWFNEACKFVEKQPTGYNAGIRLLEGGESTTMEEFRQQKHNYKTISKESKDAWLKEWVFL